jgi:hypothetical protein
MRHAVPLMILEDEEKGFRRPKPLSSFSGAGSSHRFENEGLREHERDRRFNQNPKEVF